MHSQKQFSSETVFQETMVPGLYAKDALQNSVASNKSHLKIDALFRISASGSISTIIVTVVQC